jgi:hypothetical protein
MWRQIDAEPSAASTVRLESALASALLVCDFEPFLKQRPASAMPHQLSGIIPKLLPAAENMYGFHRL